jgi:hypothetical protein
MYVCMYVCMYVSEIRIKPHYDGSVSLGSKLASMSQLWALVQLYISAHIHLFLGLLLKLAVPDNQFSVVAWVVAGVATYSI